MEEHSYLTSRDLASLPVEAETAVWQSRLDNASGRKFVRLAGAAAIALTERLGVLDATGEPGPVFFAGAGLYEDDNGNMTRRYKKGINPTFYGYSQGVRVIEIPAYDEHDAGYRLVHTISIIPGNSVNQGNGHVALWTAHLPVELSNFMPLGDLAGAYRNSVLLSDNHSEEVAFLGQEFGNKRRRARFRVQQPWDVRRAESEQLTGVIESRIGDRGCALTIQSASAYVVDAKADGTLMISPVDVLQAAPRNVTFLGVGDFETLIKSGLAVSQDNFETRLHDGLFIAVTLSDADNDKSDLVHQALLVPLAGNLFDYEHL